MASAHFTCLAWLCCTGSLGALLGSVRPAIALPVEVLSPSQPTPVAVDLDSPPETPSSAVEPVPSDNEALPEPQPDPAVDADALFERVFGRPRRTQDAQRVVVPFAINNLNQGDIGVLVTLGDATAVQINAETLLAATPNFVRPDIQTQLAARVDATGLLSIQSLQDLGLEAVFNETTLTLQIQVPPRLRRQQVIGEEERLPPGFETALRPGTVSGYINVRGGQDYVWTGSATTGRQPLTLGADAALNLQGWVLETSATFTEEGTPELARGEARLVRDLPRQALRLTAGDLTIPPRGYQSAVPIGGVSVEKNYSLQPYLVTRPINQFEFFLETRSQVEVYINGLLLRTLQLEAGPQNLRDITLSTGANDVTLVVTDAVGRVQTLNFAVPVAAELLRTGFQQFAYSIGVRSSRQGSSFEYDLDQPVLTASHRLGVSNTLTLGGYLQADLDQQLLGLEAAWATPLGNFGLDTALSHQSGLDYGARLRYQFFRPGRVRSPSFSLFVERRGPNFAPFNGTPSQVAWDLGGNYSQRLFAGIGANLGFSYQVGRGDLANAYQASLGLSKSFRSGWGGTLTFSHRRDQTGRREEQVFVSIGWLIPGRNQSLRTSVLATPTNQPSYQTTWNYNTRRFVGGFNTSVGVSASTQDIGLTGSLSYRNSRSEFALSHNAGFPQTDGSRIRNTSRLTFGTAIAFVDGVFAWTRPITGSFAIVARNPGFRGRQVGVNPSLSGFAATIGTFGPAVLPSLTPYTLSTLRIDAPDLPLGYALGETTFQLVPSYRSGTLIRVGTDATVFIRGVLIDAEGDPIPLVAGTITDQADPSRPGIELFTNRVGRFAVEGLRPGRYQLRLQATPATLTFEIPANTVGLYDLGTLRLLPSPGSLQSP